MFCSRPFTTINATTPANKALLSSILKTRSISPTRLFLYCSLTADSVAAFSCLYVAAIKTTCKYCAFLTYGMRFYEWSSPDELGVLAAHHLGLDPNARFWSMTSISALLCKAVAKGRNLLQQLKSVLMP